MKTTIFYLKNIIIASILFSIGCIDTAFVEIESPPTIISPQNNTVINQYEIEFSWEPTHGADSYMIEILDKSGNVVLDVKSSSDRYHKWEISDLIQGEYYWRVVGLNHFQKSPSEKALISIFPAPNIPRLYPINGECNQPITISWRKVDRSISYKLKIVNEKEQKTIVDLELKEISYQVKKTLENGQYFVSLQSINDLGNYSNPSEKAFTIISNPIPNSLPLTCNQQPILSWTPIEDASAYECSVFRKKDNKLIFKERTENSFVKVKKVLEYDKYYWRVISIGAGCDSSDYKDEDLEITSDLPSFNLLSPENESKGLPCVTFKWEALPGVDEYRIEATQGSYENMLNGFPAIIKDSEVYSITLPSGSIEWRVWGISGACEKLAGPFHYTVNIPYDDIPPTITLAEPKADTILKDYISINGIAEDNTGIAEVHWRVSSCMPWEIIYISCESSYEYHASTDLTELSLFPQYPLISVRAVDMAGNMSNEITINENDDPYTCGPNSIATLGIKEIGEWGIAPGNFANGTSWNDPVSVLRGDHSPVTADGSGKALSLGYWGGRVIAHFHKPVKNYAGVPTKGNTKGLDFIVYGNNSIMSFTEPAYIEVSNDANQNGLADDKWYLILGWDEKLWTNKRTMTYHKIDTNLAPDSKADWPTTSPWDSFYPDEITFSGYYFTETDPEVFSNVYRYEVWGYAEIFGANITSEQPWYVPSDPFSPPAGSIYKSGEAIDISWAIDTDSGLSVELDEIHFIRITTGIYNEHFFGGQSPEIYGISRVID